MNMRRTLQIVAFVSTTVMIAACAGVPFSTLWHFRNFGPRDFLQTDPAAVRAAIQLDDGVNLENTAPELNVSLKFKGEPAQKFAMPLVVLKKGPWVGAGAQGAEQGKHWYLMGLSDKGVARYRDLQGVIAKHLDASGKFKKHGSIEIAVHTGPMHFSHAEIKRLRRDDRVFTQARLELSSKEGFYTLYRGNFKVSPGMVKKMSGSG